MTLWSGVVGYSGTAKTPGLNVTTKALAAIENSRRSQVADLRRTHEARVEVAKAANKKWKAEVQAAVDAGHRAPTMPVEALDPGPFVEPRLFVSNSTVERLAVLLQGRPRGLSLVDDELAGLFLNMGRYTGGSDREFWLQAWNGGRFVVERQGRPPVVLDHLLVGMTAELNFLVGQTHQGLVVPSTAIMENTAWRVVSPGKYQPVPVTLGVRTLEKYEITSGLSAGDQIVADAKQVAPIKLPEPIKPIVPTRKGDKPE